MLIEADKCLHVQLYKQAEERVAQAALSDPSSNLWDVQLQGSDGRLVSASRYVLARESPFFHRLLVSEFADSNSKILKVDVPGSVLQKLVTAVHTSQVLPSCHKCL